GGGPRTGLKRGPRAGSGERLSVGLGVVGYLREADDRRLVDLILPLLEPAHGGSLSASAVQVLVSAMPGLKQRAKTLVELAENAKFYILSRPIPIDPSAEKLLDTAGLAILTALADLLTEAPEWSAKPLEEAVRTLAENQGIKLGKIAQPMRAALSGSTMSPPIFEVMEILGRKETLARIQDALHCTTTGSDKDRDSGTVQPANRTEPVGKCA
ncbi:MAG: hypothetical protein ABT940_11140, partial [Alphaproteobacteria bacterium]